MSNAGKIKFKKENDKPRFMDSIIFILIIILCVVTVVTIQLKSQQKRESEPMNSKRVDGISESEAVNTGVSGRYEELEESSGVDYVPMEDRDVAEQLQEASLFKEKDTLSVREDEKSEPEKAEEPSPEKTLEFTPPVEGTIIKKFSSSELLYSKTLDDWRMHLGVDIAVPIGTEVLSCEAGKIEEIRDDEKYGATVTVRHNERLVTIYSNLALSHCVTVGQEVAKGQKIGVVGDTAMYEILDEAHLHFSVSDNGALVNPDKYIKLKYE